MPDEHSRLSPSASARWISCPASVRLIEDLELAGSPSSVYAEEGTLAHELAEIKGSYAFRKIPKSVYASRYSAWAEKAAKFGLDEAGINEMAKHVNAYIALLRERLDRYPNSQIMLECRVPTGVPQSWGTADAVIFSPVHVEVVDLKYGAGVKVDAYENSQTMLYGCGALDEYGDLLGDVSEIFLTIFQPRAGDGEPSTFSLSADDLRAWRNSILPVAEEALHATEPSFGPSEKACRWCPVAGVCRARMEKVTAEDFGRPYDLLSVEEIGDVLGRIPEIEAWCKAVKEKALDLAYSGGLAIPGWKVVLGTGRRGISDDALAIQTLIDAGFPVETVARPVQAKTLGELEKVVGGRAALDEILDGILVKRPGNPALVPEKDRRAAVSPNTEAAKEFSE